ncbi:hypothetical protein ACFLY6_03410, partial [Candidatus Dependentiae bacterium]
MIEINVSYFYMLFFLVPTYVVFTSDFALLNPDRERIRAILGKLPIELCDIVSEYSSSIPSHEFGDDEMIGDIFERMKVGDKLLLNIPKSRLRSRDPLS